MEDDFDPWNQPVTPRVVPGWVVAAIAAGLWVILYFGVRGHLS